MMDPAAACLMFSFSFFFLEKYFRPACQMIFMLQPSVTPRSCELEDGFRKEATSKS